MEEKKYINVIVTPEEKAIIEQASEKIGIRNATTFTRMKALESAKEILKQ